MRYPFATEFKFDFQGEELTAYFDQSNNLIDIDDDDSFGFLSPDEYNQAKIKAKSDYEAYLKQQEADAKDWENTKWHLEQQFKVL